LDFFRKDALDEFFASIQFVPSFQSNQLLQQMLQCFHTPGGRKTKTVGLSLTRQALPKFVVRVQDIELPREVFRIFIFKEETIDLVHDPMALIEGYFRLFPGAWRAIRLPILIHEIHVIHG
jgi:hypothetical protein